MKNQHFLLCFLLFFGPSAVLAQPYQPPVFTDAERMKKIEAVLPTIDKIYKEYAEKNHFPGFTYGVVADGKLIHTGGLGYTDETQKTAAGAQSLFRIASMSKSFTTMAILQLRDAGKLNLDDRADQYIAEMKNTKSTDIDQINENPLQENTHSGSSNSISPTLSEAKKKQIQVRNMIKGREINIFFLFLNAITRRFLHKHA